MSWTAAQTLRILPRRMTTWARPQTQVVRRAVTAPQGPAGHPATWQKGEPAPQGTPPCPAPGSYPDGRDLTQKGFTPPGMGGAHPLS